jgi:hypothetical protein
MLNDDVTHSLPSHNDTCLAPAEHSGNESTSHTAFIPPAIWPRFVPPSLPLELVVASNLTALLRSCKLAQALHWLDCSTSGNHSCFHCRVFPYGGAGEGRIAAIQDLFLDRNLVGLPAAYQSAISNTNRYPLHSMDKSQAHAAGAASILPSAPLYAFTLYD